MATPPSLLRSLKIWIGSDQEFLEFTTDINTYGSLQWVTSELKTRDLDFLDLTMSIGPDGRIHFKTFQKAINLYLYIPPSSAHPPGVLKSIIFGNLRRYWQQNTSIDDYISIARQFADRLEARGHKRSTITDLFMEATRVFDSRQHTTKPTADIKANENGLYLHWEWHPKGISRQQLRQAYTEHESDKTVTVDPHKAVAARCRAYQRKRRQRWTPRRVPSFLAKQQCSCTGSLLLPPWHRYRI
jgi:hypothetical protein